MQNRPSEPGRRYAPYDLVDEFPVAGGYLYFQQDKEIEELHQHNGLEIGYCYSGSGIFVIENKVFTFSKGCVSIINDAEMHLAQSTPGTQSPWRFIILDPAKLLKASAEDISILNIEDLEVRISETSFQVKTIPVFLQLFRRSAMVSSTRCSTSCRLAPKWTAPRPRRPGSAAISPGMKTPRRRSTGSWPSIRY